MLQTMDLPPNPMFTYAWRATDDGNGGRHGSMLPHNLLHLHGRGQVLGIGHACVAHGHMDTWGMQAQERHYID